MFYCSYHCCLHTTNSTHFVTCEPKQEVRNTTVSLFFGIELLPLSIVSIVT